MNPKIGELNFMEIKDLPMASELNSMEINEDAEIFKEVYHPPECRCEDCVDDLAGYYGDFNPYNPE